MQKRLLLISFISILLFSNCYSQKKEQLAKQGIVKEKDYLIEIPFRYIDKHIFIEVVISGKKYNFLFDSGYELSVIDKDIAKEIDYKPKKQIEISGSSFTMEKVELIEIPKISISTINFDNTNGILQNLAFIKKNYDSIEVNGIIGNNLMRKSNWQIDYQKKTIKISDKADSFKIAKNAYPIKLYGKNWGISYLDLTINTKKHKFLFDLGSSGKFTADTTFLKFLDVKSTELVKSGNHYKVPVKKIILDKIEILNQIISIEKGVSSLIGNGFFENYLLTIDWNNNKLYLEPKEETETIKE